MLRQDFEYDLPSELIAKEPMAERSMSRLMLLHADTGAITHSHFHCLTEQLNAGDLLVLNDTRVIPARLIGHKVTGGKIEILVERILADMRIVAQIRASKAPKVGTRLVLAEGALEMEVLAREGDLFELACLHELPPLALLERYGQVPLPPYIDRPAAAVDTERYQTVFAKHKGSVAAPTAGLHFDHALLHRLQQAGVELGYVTLHVGAGTFQSLRTDKLQEHVMHSEYCHVSTTLCQQVQATRRRGGKVVAVGTTCVRSLETAAASGQLQPFAGETSIFIYPGYEFHCVDAMVTNFHLPGSTLLMLVAAFSHLPMIKAAYACAINERYRFYSYGDAMYLYR